ncbi:MAG: cupin [Chloroflexia bacterium]|nr:cupin [Chloroflexia bacterium]
MKLYRFDREVTKQITQYDSQNLFMARIARLDGKTSVDCMYLDAHGVVGFHQASSNQLFMVVQGSGWARGEDEQRGPIEAGQAAFWEASEWHESGTDDGMLVIVIEGPLVDPTGFMPELTG